MWLEGVRLDFTATSRLTIAAVSIMSYGIARIIAAGRRHRQNSGATARPGRSRQRFRPPRRRARRRELLLPRAAADEVGVDAAARAGAERAARASPAGPPSQFVAALFRPRYTCFVPCNDGASREA